MLGKNIIKEGLTLSEMIVKIKMLIAFKLVSRYISQVH